MPGGAKKAAARALGFASVAVMLGLSVPSAAAEEPRPELARHVIDGNLASAVFGRYALTYQLSPTAHHALAVTGWRQSSGVTFLWDDGLMGVGGEVAWRLYTGSHGPEGFFVGPAGVVGYHTTDKTAWFASYGAGVDLGWSALFRAESIGRVKGKVHFAIAGGLQLMGTEVDTSSLQAIPSFLAGRGFAPRVSLVVGQSP